MRSHKAVLLRVVAPPSLFSISVFVSSLSLTASAMRQSVVVFDTPTKLANCAASPSASSSSSRQYFPFLGSFCHRFFPTHVQMALTNVLPVLFWWNWKGPPPSSPREIAKGAPGGGNGISLTSEDDEDDTTYVGRPSERIQLRSRSVMVPDWKQSSAG